MLKAKVWSCLAVGVALSGNTAFGESIADAISSNLGNGPQVLAFDDDTRVQLARDTGVVGVLDQGDRFRAQLVFRNINQVIGNQTVTLGGVGVQPQSEVNELTGYVEIEVTGKSGSAATGYTFTFGAWSDSGTLVNNFGSGAIIALYEDPSKNGMLSGLPIPDGTMVDGQLFAVLGLGGPGETTLNLQTDAQPGGLHRDDSSAALVPAFETLGQGNLRVNLVDQGGNAITDESNGLYDFGQNSYGTDFAGTFDYFGGGGTGADFTAAMELRSTVTIIPLPPAFLAAMPGLALMAFVSHRRRRLA